MVTCPSQELRYQQCTPRTPAGNSLLDHKLTRLILFLVKSNIHRKNTCNHCQACAIALSQQASDCLLSSFSVDWRSEMLFTTSAFTRSPKSCLLTAHLLFLHIDLGNSHQQFHHKNDSKNLENIDEGSQKTMNRFALSVTPLVRHHVSYPCCLQDQLKAQRVVFTCFHLLECHPDLEPSQHAHENGL